MTDQESSEKALLERRNQGSRIAEMEARECAMREALDYAGKIANDAAMVIDRLDGYDFHGSSKLALILALNHVASKAKAALAAAWRGWCRRNRANFAMLSRKDMGAALEGLK